MHMLYLLQHQIQMPVGSRGKASDWNGNSDPGPALTPGVSLSKTRSSSLVASLWLPTGAPKVGWVKRRLRVLVK